MVPLSQRSVAEGRLPLPARQNGDKAKETQKERKDICPCVWD